MPGRLYDTEEYAHAEDSSANSGAATVTAACASVTAVAFPADPYDGRACSSLL